MPVEQDDLSIYFSHDPASVGSSAGHQIVDNNSSNFNNTSSIYAHHHYSPAAHCMYEQQNYSLLPTEHQQSGGTVSSQYPWWRNNGSHNRAYPYGSSNYVPLHQQQQQQSSSPIDERSSSAQSYASSPSCPSIQSPAISPANVVNNFVYNSNSNSPVAQQSANQGLTQQQPNYQELYSPVPFNLTVHIYK